MYTSLRLPTPFRSFAHRNYLLWFFGQGISLIGTWMQTMAQQVLVYRLTGSAASLGIISFIGLIPHSNLRRGRCSGVINIWGVRCFTVPQGEATLAFLMNSM